MTTRNTGCCCDSGKTTAPNAASAVPQPTKDLQVARQEESSCCGTQPATAAQKAPDTGKCCG